MKFIILLLLLIPTFSSGCFDGPRAAPGYGMYTLPQLPDSDNLSDFPKLSDADRDKAVWLEMGYFDIAPYHWGEVKQISNKYYSLQIFSGGPGSCGPKSIYIYRTFLHNMTIGLVFTFLLVYFSARYITNRKRAQV